MTIKDFRELRVFRTAFDSAMEIFELSKKWPVEERYSLTSQIRRSSRSICGNIAEAWRKRRYPASFVSKLSDADGEARLPCDNGYGRSHPGLVGRHESNNSPSE